MHLDLIRNDKKNKNLEVLYFAILSNVFGTRKCGSKKRVNNVSFVMYSADFYVAGCFKIECNGCYIHGIFVNWDTCAVLLNCEKDSIQNICYCSTQITSRRAGFSCTFPH